MLRSVKSLQKLKIKATDGDIGHIVTLYFDDEQWTVRYLVVDTTSWRLGPQVLISPMAIRQSDWETGTVLLSISREQIRNSPPIDTQGPVSREHERELLRYYNHPNYWAEASDDAQLRSTREVIGYHMRAVDGELGHVDDFLVDDQTWAIRYAVVDTSNWWLGKKVLIAAEWIDRVSWSDAKLSVDLSRQAVKEAPAYDPDMQIERQWETDYFAHYQRHGYWQTRGRATSQLVSLKQHHEFQIAGTDSDPRGWQVVTGADGRRIGRVDDLIADPLTMKVRYLDVDLESGIQQGAQQERHTHILLPVGYARLSANGDRVTVEGLSSEDIQRLPAYEALPISPQYDEVFRQSVGRGDQSEGKR